MAQTIQMIALGKWENRATLNYQPVNSKLANGRRYNAFGVPIQSPGDPSEVRRPYKMEEAGGTVYIMYDDDRGSDVPIFKSTEV